MAHCCSLAVFQWVVCWQLLPCSTANSTVCLIIRQRHIWITGTIFYIFIFSLFISKLMRRMHLSSLRGSIETSFLWALLPRLPFFSVKSLWSLCLHIISEFLCFFFLFFFSGCNPFYCRFCWGRILFTLDAGAHCLLPLSSHHYKMCSESKRGCIWSSSLGDVVGV